MQDTASVARRTVTVKLSSPVEWHEAVITAIDIREPSAADFFEHGPPTLVVHSPAGGASVVDNSFALNAYVKSCIKVDQPDLFFRFLPLADGRAIKAALLSFFHDAPEETSS